MGLDTLIGGVADHFQIEPQIVKSASKKRAIARAWAIVCCLAVDHLRLSAADVARRLSLTPSAVSKLLVQASGWPRPNDGKRNPQFKIAEKKDGKEHLGI